MYGLFGSSVHLDRVCPLLCRMSESPSGKREGLQDNATGKKGEVYYWLEPGPSAASNAVVQVREPRAQAVTQIYRESTRRL